VRQARKTHDHGLEQIKVGRFDRAIDAFKQARVLLARAPAGAPGRPVSLRAINDLALANTYRKVGKLREARATYDEALKRARSLRHPLLQAAVLNNLASLLLATGAVEEAHACWREARAARPDSQLLAQIDNGLGSCLLAGHDPAAAQRRFNSARTLAREAGAVRETVLALNGLARCAAMSGDASRAARLFEEALTLAREHKLLAAVHLTQVNAAAHAMRRGRFLEALQRLDAVRDRVDAVVALDQRAALLHNLGGIYLAAGMAKDALVYYRQAAQLADDPAFALSAAGALLAADQPVDAEKALKRAARILDPRDRRGRTETEWLRGWIALRRGDTKKAVSAIEQACRGGRPTREHRVRCTFGRAWLALELGQFGDAIRIARRSLGHFSSLGDQQGALKSRLVLARAYEQAGKQGPALETYLAASDDLEQLRPRMGSEQLKMGYQASRSELYGHALRLLAQRLPGDVVVSERVVRLMERSRARGLLDLVQQGQLLAQSRADPGHQREVARWLLRVQRLQAELGRTTDEKKMARLEQRLAEALRRLDTARTRLISSLPTTAHASLPDLKQLMAESRATGQALVSYYLSGELGLVLAVNAKGYDLRRLADPPATIRRVGLLVQLVRAHQDGAEYRQAFAQLAHQLYQDLVLPVRERVHGLPLVISTHGALTQLPFQVLLSEPAAGPWDRPDFYATQVYLVHQHTLSYTPSLALWTARRKIPPGARDAVRAALELGALLGIGDPRRLGGKGRASEAEPGRPMRGLRAIRHLLRGGTLPPLPHGRREVEEIARLFRQSRTYLGSSATETAFKAALGRKPYRFVHLAAHGLIDEEQPAFSSIVLVPGGSDDGLLELAEIYQLPLRMVELTVLSACQTALGRQISGEGMVGLVRGFLAAGSRRVIASLWSVSDESTRLLMARFYQHLARGSSFSAALQQAQIAGARGGLGASFAHPFYWAPFGLYGQAEPKPGSADAIR